MTSSHFQKSHTNSCKRKVYRKVSVEDKAKNIIQTYNKENKIISQTIGSKVVTYKYDFQSKRVSKTVANGALTTTEYFVRDPKGNVLAIYADTLQNGKKFTLSELHIYGSSRLGIYKVDSVLWENGTTATTSNKYSFKLGQKRYELSNHLGNVQTVISDRKLVDVQTNGIITAYKADVQSVTDYFPFGKTITERTWSISKTRYDFNGKETDQESGYQDYGFRDYDVEICRFLQVDPLHGKYPELSTYQFASNTPICAIDLDGKEADPAPAKQFINPQTPMIGPTFHTAIDGSGKTTETPDGIGVCLVRTGIIVGLTFIVPPALKAISGYSFWETGWGVFSTGVGVDIIGQTAGLVFTGQPMSNLDISDAILSGGQYLLPTSNLSSSMQMLTGFGLEVPKSAFNLDFNKGPNFNTIGESFMNFGVNSTIGIGMSWMSSFITHQTKVPVEFIFSEKELPFPKLTDRPKEAGNLYGTKYKVVKEEPYTKTTTGLSSAFGGIATDASKKLIFPDNTDKLMSPTPSQNDAYQHVTPKPR